MTDHTVKLVNSAGVGSTLTSAVPEADTSELNGWGSGSFTMHARDPQVTSVQLLSSEVQFYRGTDLTFWGRPTRVTADADRVRFDCNGIGSELFDRRFIGRADRTDLLAGAGDFEGASLAPWTATANTTATQDTSWRKTGTKSAKLVNAQAGEDAYISLTLDNYPATAVGSLLTLVKHFRIAGTGWVGPAMDRRGLVLVRKHATTGAILETAVFEIDEYTPRDSDQRAEVTIWMPPNAVEDIEARPYSPGCIINWDAGRLVLMESLSNYQTDQTEIARQVVVHLQDPAFGKNNLNVGTDTPATGVLRDRHYQHADHLSGTDVLSEFPQLSDGFDYAIIFTPTTRTFRTFFPRRGTRHAGLTLTDQNVSSWEWRGDGDNACSSITVLGEGDGPDREEGAAVDSTVYGGLILEDVVAAPPGADVDTLDAFAAETLRARKESKVLTVTVPAQSAWFVVQPGDTLPSNFAWGFSTFSNDWRVINRTLDHTADALIFEMNVA